MSPTNLTRKPVTELTAQDLETFHIWEYATDEEHVPGRDETWVRPVENEKIPRGAYSQIVAADFTTAAGCKLRGFMTLTTAQKEAEIRSGAVISGKYLVLPAVSREVAVRESYTWSLKERDVLLEALASKEADVFPIHYRLTALVAGEKSMREDSIA
jgi:hypothetical protein